MAILTHTNSDPSKSKDGKMEDKRVECECGKQSESERHIKEKTKVTIWRNVGLLTLGTHLSYSAYYGIGSLQVILYSENRMYQIASQLTLGLYAAASYFFPALLVSHFGLKRTIVITFAMFITYVLANYYPAWYTIVPTAALRGIGGGIFWNIKGTSLTILGNMYSRTTGESIDVSIPRFFGIFFGGYQASFVTAILVSSFLINTGSNRIRFEEECIEKYCFGDIGHFFPDVYSNDSGNSTRHLQDTRTSQQDHLYLLYGIFTVLVLCAIFVVLMMTADKRLDGASGQHVTPFSLVIASLKHLFKPFDLLLLPLYLYIGVVDAFSGSELSMGLIPCTSGLENVRYVFTVFGLSSALFGVLSGYVVRYTGRPLVVMFGFLCHAVVILTMQYLHLDYRNEVTIILISAGWGIAAVILDVQISALIGCVYPENPAPAIANFILFQICGNSLWRLFSNMMCLQVQLYFVLIVLVASMIGYIAIEVIMRKNSDRYIIRQKGRDAAINVSVIPK